MNDNGKESLVQDIFVGENGVLQLGMCDWFWTLGTSQMRDWLEKIQRDWASIHSPDDPSKSTLSCWVPDMKNTASIPIKVDSAGVSEDSAQKLSDETRGKLSEARLKQYQHNMFEELRNRPKK